MKSLRGKIIISFIILSLTCVLFTSAISYYEIYKISTENMRADGGKVADQIKNDLDLTGTGDITSVQSYVEAAKQMNNEISFIAFLDNNKELANSDKMQIGKNYINKYTKKVFKDGKTIGFTERTYKGEKVYNVLVPMKSGSSITNILSVGMSMKNMNSKITEVITTILIASIIILLFSLLISRTLASNILKPLNKFMEDFDILSNGDLRVNFSVNNKDEISKLAEVMNKTMDNLRGMIKVIKGDVIEIDKTAIELIESSENISRTSKESLKDINLVSMEISKQSSDIINIEGMINKFGANLDLIYEKLDSVANNSEGIKLSADTGTTKIVYLTNSLKLIKDSFDKVIGKIEQLSESVNSISQITNVINDVAGQTNLLALNAAIEAARVGEEGKGFAVVADEIRKLANQVLESSKSIDKLIFNVKNETKEVSSTSRLVSEDMQSQLKELEDAIASFRGILSEVSEIVPHIKNVEGTLEKSVNEKNDLLFKIEEISEVAKKVSGSSEEIAASIELQSSSTSNLNNIAENLNDMSKMLTNSVEKFII